MFKVNNKDTKTTSLMTLVLMTLVSFQNWMEILERVFEVLRVFY